MNLYEAIANRQSVRKFIDKELSEKLQEQIFTFIKKASRLNDRIEVEAELIKSDKKNEEVRGLWKVEAPYYLVIYSETTGGYERNAGYILEQLVLYLTTKGVGSCYLGGSYTKDHFKNNKKQVMILALGYPDGKLLRESPFAKRLPLNELCTFKEEAGEQMKTVLRAARLSPSAMNHQPWRFIVYSDRIYVFKKKSPFTLKKYDEMREFGIGIMLSHIMLASEELWMELETVTEEQFAAKNYKNGEYVATLYLR